MWSKCIIGNSQKTNKNGEGEIKYSLETKTVDRLKEIWILVAYLLDLYTLIR